MPTYEHVCTACKHEWEIVQKMSDPRVTDCPACHQATAQRLISRTSFALKGDGWYGDGYAAKPPPAAEKPAPSSGPSDSAMAAATTCPTVTAVGK